MKLIEAQRLCKQMRGEAPACRVTGLRGTQTAGSRGESYSIDAVDTRTGIPFVVDSAEQWADRLAAAGFYESLEG